MAARAPFLTVIKVAVPGIGQGRGVMVVAERGAAEAAVAYVMFRITPNVGDYEVFENIELLR